MEDKGTATRSMALDGRVLVEEFKGSMMGMPFTGHGMTGYDNVTGKYWSTWMDSMSTAIFVTTGTMSDAKTFNYTGTMTDPMTGKDMKSDSKVTLTDADHHTMEAWAPGPDGKMYRNMEIVYTRKK